MADDRLAVSHGTYEIENEHGTATVHAPRDWTGGEMAAAAAPLLNARNGGRDEEMADAA